MSSSIRRTASSLLPRTIRSIGQTTYFCSTISTTTLNTTPTNTKTFSEEFRQTPGVQTRNFSSGFVNTDNHLLRAIKSEITCEEELDDYKYRDLDTVPDGFPFKLEDEPGRKTVYLKREYRGEVIKVVVHLPEGGSGNNDGEDEGEDKGEDENDGSTIALVVSVSKGKNESWLEFGITAYTDEITIDSLIIKHPDTCEDDLAYEGPEFLDLDDNLQKVFFKYLEDRDIKPSTTNFLHEYMVKKDNREYLTWLKTLKNFIEE